MTRLGRNPRRAYDAERNEIEPMTLGGMRAHGVQIISASCEALGCGHEAKIDVSTLPDDLLVPDVSLNLRCSACGGRRIKTVPAWHTNPKITKPRARGAEHLVEAVRLDLEPCPVLDRGVPTARVDTSVE